MLNQTNDYDMFKFREDNRAKIDNAHVKRLIDSISKCNLLELRPIYVNDKMEVIDGQHRLLAAKSLQVPVYYKIEESLQEKEIILMNISKSWTDVDYLNFYVKNGYQEYINLNNFIVQNKISLRVALSTTVGSDHVNRDKFRKGEYVFECESLSVNVDLCWQTINYIRRMNGYCPHLNSSRFWKALIKVVAHHNFDEQKWFKNLEMMVDKCTAKANTESYTALLLEIHNWRNTNKINEL